MRVTMLEHVTSLIAQLDRRFDTLHQDLKDSINDRFEAVQHSAEQADRRYEQRFEAQQTATSAALTAADKSSVAAMTAAEKAVVKAELASDKRFESVNEFRKTLSDQTASFLPRPEAVAQFAALASQIETGLQRIADQINDAKDRSTRIENDITAIKSSKQGGKETLVGIYGFAGFLVSLLVLGGILAAAGVFSK